MLLEMSLAPNMTWLDIVILRWVKPENILQRRYLPVYN